MAIPEHVEVLEQGVDAVPGGGVGDTQSFAYLLKEAGSFKGYNFDASKSTQTGGFFGIIGGSI